MADRETTFNAKNQVNIYIPAKTKDWILAIAATHRLNLPIPKGGPCVYHLESDRYERLIEMLKTLDSMESVKMLINELYYYREHGEQQP
jgi:hypothetical protein